MTNESVPEPTSSRFDLSQDREAAFDAAARAIGQGRCIVLPTDTVYGIGADPFDPDAVQGLLNAKQRGRDMPPPVLIAEPAMLRALVDSVPDSAERLVSAFWPGALTLICKAQSELRMDLGTTHGTIAVRVPDDRNARDLLRHTGPLAVSSANISGRPPATTVDDASAMLGEAVAVYLDGGPTPGAVASTIIDFTGTATGRIVRAGVIPFEELAEVAPGLVDLAPPAGEEEPDA
ncbi:hypothetical protein GCM10009785_06500 [Brooklawnia cerclae]|uniref:L-threonylcarbamoyladenylate synthase n=1 Tax=Brooklawnia cerclae TaxID=349934 RepID=A0ABX0SDF8_9ACTN|nr:tRNA threonylcarbamoyl adenosine modification protein (Sua5/YciO/YrdC/YwlC family) [Brooklawnia cerclae]